MLLARCQSKHSLPSFPSGSTDSDNYLLTSVLLWESEGTVEKFQHTVEAKILGIATLKRVKKKYLTCVTPFQGGTVTVPRKNIPSEISPAVERASIVSDHHLPSLVECFPEEPIISCLIQLLK